MDGFHESKWFVYVTDHHEGPFSMAQMEDKLRSGEVHRSQYVWCQGMPDWQPMPQVTDFHSVLEVLDRARAEAMAEPVVEPPPARASMEAEPPAPAVSPAAASEPIMDSAPAMELVPVQASAVEIAAQKDPPTAVSLTIDSPLMNTSLADPPAPEPISLHGATSDDAPLNFWNSTENPSVQQGF